jgi:hypothetical protein
MGSVARSCARRASRSSPSSRADSGVSTNPAAIRLTRTGAISRARLATRARRPAEPNAGAAYEQQRAAAPDLAHRVLADPQRHQQVRV